MDGGAPAGAPPDASTQTANSAWSIGSPDAICSIPQPILIPATGELDYQYIIVPTGFRTDRWVQRVELRPSDPSVVHHAVVYIREPGSTWLRTMPRNQAFSAPPGQRTTTSNILFTYTPGNASDKWPAGMAKLIPAGSDLVFQMHYTPGHHATSDCSQIGLVFAQGAPAERVLSLQLNNDRFIIPPGIADYQVRSAGTLPGDCGLLSLHPHMHLRGKAFEYSVVEADGTRRTLLRVNHYDFDWQLNYKLAEPLALAAGTKLEAIATYDNSKNNPRNPDPDIAVHYGEKSSDEMMVGFFDIAVPSAVDKFQFFERRPPPVR